MKRLYRYHSEPACSTLVTCCDFCFNEITAERLEVDAPEPEPQNLPAGEVCQRCQEIFAQLAAPALSVLRQDATDLADLLKQQHSTNAEIRDELTARNAALQVELARKEEALKAAATLSLASTSLVKGESVLDLSARAAVIKESKYLLLLRDGADHLERVLFGGVPTEKTEVEKLGVILLNFIQDARRAVETSGRSLPTKAEQTEEEREAAEKRQAFDHAVKLKDASIKEATAKQLQIAKRSRRGGHNRR